MKFFKKLKPMSVDRFVSDLAEEVDPKMNIMGRTFIGNPGQVNSIFNRDYKILNNPAEAYDVLIDRLNKMKNNPDLELEPLIVYLKNGFNSFFKGDQDPLFRLPLMMNVCYVYDKPDFNAHGGLDLREEA